MSSSAGSSAFQASRASRPALARGRKLRPSLKVDWREGERRGIKRDVSEEKKRKGGGVRKEGRIEGKREMNSYVDSGKEIPKLMSF